MLIEKIDETITIINKYQEANERQLRYQDYEKSYNNLLSVAPTCQLIMESFKVLKENNSSNPYINITDMVNSLSELESGFLNGTNPPSIQKINKLSNQLDEITVAMKAHWRLYIQNKTSKLIDALKAIESLVDDSKEIQRLIKQIEDIKNIWPLKESIIIKMDDLINQASIIMADLDVSEEVQVFLNLVISEKARFCDITPTIMAWLEKNKLGKNLEISFVRR